MPVTGRATVELASVHAQLITLYVFTTLSPSFISLADNDCSASQTLAIATIPIPI